VLTFHIAVSIDCIMEGAYAALQHDLSWTQLRSQNMERTLQLVDFIDSNI
jgi:hypothetical protein